MWVERQQGLLRQKRSATPLPVLKSSLISTKPACLKIFLRGTGLFLSVINPQVLKPVLQMILILFPVPGIFFLFTAQKLLKSG